MVWLPDGEKIYLFVLAQLSNVTDRQTDGQTDTAWRVPAYTALIPLMHSVPHMGHSNKLSRKSPLVVE